MSLSQLIPLHIVRIKTEGMITFCSISLGWKDNHTEFSSSLFYFLELMYRVITRCIIFVLDYTVRRVDL